MFIPFILTKDLKFKAPFGNYYIQKCLFIYFIFSEFIMKRSRKNDLIFCFFLKKKTEIQLTIKNSKLKNSKLKLLKTKIHSEHKS